MLISFILWSHFPRCTMDKCRLDTHQPLAFEMECALQSFLNGMCTSRTGADNQFTCPHKPLIRPRSNPYGRSVDLSSIHLSGMRQVHTGHPLPSTTHYLQCVCKSITTALLIHLSSILFAACQRNRYLQQITQVY